MNITKEIFDKVYAVFELLINLKNESKYGETYTFNTKWAYRKNEYVFGIDMQCDLGGNLIIKDYASVCFNDSDDGKADDSDFEKCFSEIEDFVAKVQKLKNV